MKTTAITFALLFATILCANANPSSSAIKGSSMVHKRNIKSHSTKEECPIGTHETKMSKASHTTTSDSMRGRF